MGRSDPETTLNDPFKPVKRDGVDLGLGISPKLSRAHLKIQYHPSNRSFSLHCLGKNGLSVINSSSHPEVRLVPNSPSFTLLSNAQIKLADCQMTFYLPSHSSSSSKPSVSNNITTTTPKSPSPNTSQLASTTSCPIPPTSSSTRPSTQGKRKRREWIKSEHMSLRAQMMRFGYGRWDDIITAASGRLAERHPQEIIPVARKFVARCYIHARPGVERKALMEILRHHPQHILQDDQTAVDSEVKALLDSATDEADPAEQRKYVRWARKLRLLSRLNDIHDHPSLHRLRKGNLRVFTPPPTLYWTSADDADLILGSYKHGYGAVENIRTDPELGFFNRYSKSVLSKKNQTPSKPEKTGNDAANASDDDDDDDEDADEDEDERPVNSPNGDNDDDENHPTENASHNPKKRLKLGDGSAKKEDQRSPSANRPPASNFDLSPEGELPDKPSSNVAPAVSTTTSVPPNAEKDGDKSTKDDLSDTEKSKRKVRLVPKRGPRIGNEDGFNNPEDAMAAHTSAADENGLAPFPNSEALMRRLKSIINSCAKEFDRDQRDLKKKQLAASRAKQRRDDLAEKKAIKEAEKTRQRAERRIAKSQPFSKKEAVEFEKALSNFGISYLSDGKTVDWEWFHKKVDGFEAKYSETIWSAYLELLTEAHRLRDLAAAKEEEDYDAVDKINETNKPSSVFSTLTVERAERLIDRLQFFRNLRGDVLPHPKLTSILRGFKKSRDLPPWWKSTHDKSLLLGVDWHGLNGWDEMGSDPQLAFASSMKAWQRKSANDSKSLKRAVMPKATSGIKRAFALVQYFSSRANDPHFDFYNQAENGTGTEPASNSNTVTVPPAVKTSPKREENVEVKDEPMEDVTPQNGTCVESAPNSKRKMEVSLAVQAPSGRPRTLRQTLIKIPKDENGIMILPADLGDGLFLLNLGEVVQESKFCKNGIIFPVGFRTIRQSGNLAFLCEIVANQDRTRPEFRVSEVFGFNEKASDEDYMWDGQQEIASSGNIINVWMMALNDEGIKKRLPEEHKDKIALASGPERFGLYESTIVYHIQKLPGAKYVDGFELRDFSYKGAGAKIETSAGILDVMLKALDSKLEPREDRQAYDSVMTDEEDNSREGAVVAEEEEMSVPGEWVEMYSGQKRKHRRRSSSHWG